MPKSQFPDSWRTILKEKIDFYNKLTPELQLRFERKVHEFLLNVKITGVNTEVTPTDKLYVAASAIIPILAFENWHYYNLKEVLVYPAHFNLDYEQEGEERNVLGVVGSGTLSNQMILSKKALHLGFENLTDKKNTAIHEFVHLIDKADGTVDGVPELLLDKQYTLPWLSLIHKEMEKIAEGKSDINPYGATNQAEFLAVVSEYFFERPHLFQKKHPQLYAYMNQMFQLEKNKSRENSH